MKAELLVGAYRLSPGLDPETPELTTALRSNNPGMPVHPSAVSLVNRDLARVHLVRHKDDPGADLMTVGLNVVTMPTGDPMDFDGGNWLRIDLRLEAEGDEDSAFDLSVHGVRITATALSWAHGGP